MSVSAEFMDIVAQGDKNAVRTSLANYMILDKSYKLFDESFSYASSKMDIVDEHDGQELTSDREKWTKEYLSEPLVDVVINFSKERISHIKQVIPVALKDSCSPSENKPVQTNYSSSRTGRKRFEQEIHSSQNVKMAPPPQAIRNRKPTNRSSESGGRTGRTAIYEEEISPRNGDSSLSTKRFDCGTTLIIGGVAVAVVGLAVSESIVIGAGVVIAGSGCVVKASKKK